MFKCAFCDKEFPIKTDLMNHRKKEHKLNVKQCMKARSGECNYNMNCWHTHEEVENVNQNQELFDKMFLHNGKIYTSNSES